MDRWQIIVACVVFIVIWMVGKRLFQKPDGAAKSEARDVSAQDNVETWYSRAQERAAALDEQTTAARTKAWENLSAERQLDLAEEFIGSGFAPKLLDIYTREEKLKIGRMCVVVGDRLVEPPTT